LHVVAASGQVGQVVTARPIGNRVGNGSTGLIDGAIAGGALGNAIAPGGSEVLGTVLGAVAGGAAGSAIDRNAEVRCR
jgi:outer membrane lipoprotein SlyB